MSNKILALHLIDHDVDLMNEIALIHQKIPSEWQADLEITSNSMLSLRRNLDLENSESLFWVLLHERAILGYHWLEYRPSKKSARIISTWIHENLRRQGYAARIRRAAECHLKTIGCKKISTRVSKNNSESLKLNKAVGFKLDFLCLSKNL